MTTAAQRVALGAYGERVAAVDTNVARVVARIGCVEGPVARAASRREIERLAEALVDPDRPGDFNQAMMELGALVCRPRAPRCLLCPVAFACCARTSGEPERYPAAVRQAERQTVHAACGIVRRRGRLLVVQRPERGLLGGLWEFPGGRIGEGESAEAACARGALEKTGVVVEPRGEAVVVRHAFSHFRVVLHAFACDDGGGRIRRGARARWATPAELAGLALTRTAREVVGRIA